MSLMIEWERMRLALVSHVEAGRSFRSIADEAGVSRATLLNWLHRTPPETILKATAVYEALTGKETTTNDDADGNRGG